MIRFLTLLALLLISLESFSQRETYRSENGSEEIEVEFLTTSPDSIRKLAISFDFAYIGGAFYFLNASYHEPKRYILDFRFGPSFNPETPSGLGLGFDIGGSYLFSNSLKTSSVTQSLKSSPYVQYVFTKELDRQTSYGFNFGVRNAGVYLGSETITHQSLRVGLTRLRYRHLDMKIFEKYKRRRGQTYGRWNADLMLHFNHQLYDARDNPINDDGATLGYSVFYEVKATSWSPSGRLFFSFMGGFTSSPASIREGSIILGFGFGSRFL